MYNTSMLFKHLLCCFVLLTNVLDFLSNQLPVNKKNTNNKQTNKQNKKKQQTNKNKKHTKNIQKTLQLINNVMDIVYQNNMSNQR